MNRPETQTRIAILGVGLIGGSIGLALREAGGWHVTGWDIDRAVTRVAMQRGAIDAAVDSLESAVAGVQLALLATPVSSAIRLLDLIRPHLPPDAAVTDVCSTKAHFVSAGESRFGGRFVGGHPMAGSERSGIGAADSDIFRGAPWFLTPTPATGGGSLDLVKQIVEACGAIPRICAPEEHDRLVAVLSHLPHLLAFGLAQTAGDQIPEEWRDVSGGSFRDGTRVAASSPGLWTDILIDNRYEVINALTAHGRWVEQAKAALEYRDAARLRELLERASASKAEFGGSEVADE